jgi:hypothetical protein
MNAHEPEYDASSLTSSLGANAAVLCYDITDPVSFDEMGRWLKELKTNLGDDVILHVVGTKSDVVAEDPSKRKIPFERCIAYVAENMYPAQVVAPPAPQTGRRQSVQIHGWGPAPAAFQSGGMASPQSNRSSGFWGQDIGWDCCHEISAKDGEGVEEVFRVITRKLVEQQQKRIDEEHRQFAMAGVTSESVRATRDGAGSDSPLHLVLVAINKNGKKTSTEPGQRRQDGAAKPQFSSESTYDPLTTRPIYIHNARADASTANTNFEHHHTFRFAIPSSFSDTRFVLVLPDARAAFAVSLSLGCPQRRLITVHFNLYFHCLA